MNNSYLFIYDKVCYNASRGDGMFEYKDLYHLVFDNNINADELVIITGYIGSPIVKDLENLPYYSKIYVGMYGNNVNEILHNSLLKMNEITNVNINYTNKLVHSKCYVWRKNGEIVQVLIGSANFSTSGLRSPKKEVLGQLPPESYISIQNYIAEVSENSYSVKDYAITSKMEGFVNEIPQVINEYEVEIQLLASKGGGKSNIIGVKTKAGDVHAAAGLNWGFSNGLSSPNDAYVKIPKQQILHNPLLFPAKSGDENEPIDVIWDDGTEMQMLLEGNQEARGIEYPKQISTYKNKSELGIYLRKRIGLVIGQDLVIPETLSKEQLVQNAEQYREKLITKEMLDQYGRNSIHIKLIGDRTYYFDFSTQKAK